MILVTGATGRLGKLVVQYLISKQQSVRVLVRDREKAENMLPAHVEIVTGDLSDPASILSALKDVTAIFLNTSVGPEQVTLQGNVVKAALETTQPYIVKISGLHTALNSYIDCGRWHAETEHQIELSELDYTFLRVIFFMQNLAFQFDSARSRGEIFAGVGDAKIAMIDTNDIAEVAARLLIEQNKFTKQILTLTSFKSVTYREVAETLTTILGQEVNYHEQSLDEVKIALEKSGQPEWHVNILLQFNRAFIDGYGDKVSASASEILQRPTTTLTDFLQREINSSTEDKSPNPFPS